ncbi:hypothetical protein NQ317_019085 [Molorchus minor]|uniref:Uncharacterized protein n=1 Tax=Molorchus minor TaxID=1323400 RepID=A0ABQ9JKA7_9CUCU|nr:hypothetical protein NQ317_019085 [Molorchus minor]
MSDSRSDEPQNRIIYSLPCRMGLWNEELALQEEKDFTTAYKRDHCQLLIQKTKKNNYQIATSDITVEGGYSGLYLSGVISEKDIDSVQHFRHGCTLSASPLKHPCVRNTFVIAACDSEKAGQPVPYGEDVLLQICESDDRPLYIQCENFTTDTFGNALTLRLSESPDIYCRFKLFNWNPQRRYETLGTNFSPNSRLIIQHTASGKNLAVQQNRHVELK